MFSLQLASLRGSKRLLCHLKLTCVMGLQSDEVEISALDVLNVPLCCLLGVYMWNYSGPLAYIHGCANFFFLPRKELWERRESAHVQSEIGWVT